MRPVRSALVAIFILSFFFLSCAQESATPASEEKSRSPFTTSPAEIALEEPCRYIGTFHKESRQLLEELRAQKVIVLDEWKCMARALQALDKEMTVKCKEKKEPLAVVEAWQTERYSPCLSSNNRGNEILECSLLSGAASCLILIDEPALPVGNEQEKKVE